MRVEISLEALTRLYREATLGKLMNGLIHNLNGYLQNLGMDMEMAGYSVTKEEQLPTEFARGISARLKRMTDEFENIHHLIRAAAMRAAMEEISAGTELCVFLEQELSFLKANLYFKHRVRQEVELDGPLPLLGALPNGFPLYLSWLLQAFVEELEKQKMETLALRARPSGQGIEIVLSTSGAALSEPFMKQLDMSVSGPPEIRDQDVGLMLAVLFLKTAGVSLSARNRPSGAAITLTLPALRQDG